MQYQSENFNGMHDFRCRFHRGFTVERHIHEYSELLYCRRGCGTVWINEKKLLLQEKQLIWIPPNSIHQYACEEAEVICAVFSGDLIPLFLEITGGKRMRGAVTEVGDLSSVIEELPQLSTDDAAQLLRISAYLTLICAEVMEHTAFETDALSDGALYQKVISHIAAHYTEDISLKRLAERFGYNEKYLSHALHALTGVHFSSLLALYRVEHAKKHLLKEDSPSIAEIAFSSGFVSLNTFNRAFKKSTGLTPSQYRARGRGHRGE